MVLFVTSSPYVCDADRAILCSDNEFIDRIRSVLPPCPRALFVAADPDNREDTCRFAADTTGAFSEAGMPFQSYHILDGFNAEDAEALIAGSDLILLSGGHVPTQNAFFQETGLPIVTEIMNINTLDLFDNVDVIQVGARNMQNFDLLKELGKTKKAILLKRGLANTLQELLMSAEYIMSEGNENIILCERGIRTFETYTRNTIIHSPINTITVC